MKTIRRIGILALTLALSLPAAALAYGPAGLKDGADYSLADMLTYALEGEYLARATYDAIEAEFDVSRPFSRIAGAESQHIGYLEPLFDAHDVPLPTDAAKRHVVLPASIEAVFAAGVATEEDNIAMYEQLLQNELPDDVADVFARLKQASENHLRAFERGADGGRWFERRMPQHRMPCGDRTERRQPDGRFFENRGRR